MIRRRIRSLPGRLVMHCAANNAHVLVYEFDERFEPHRVRCVVVVEEDDPRSDNALEASVSSLGHPNAFRADGDEPFEIESGEPVPRPVGRPVVDYDHRRRRHGLIGERGDGSLEERYAITRRDDDREHSDEILEVGTP